MKKVWISLRVIEGEYETENDAADGMIEGYDLNLDESHPLCDRIIGFYPYEIEKLCELLYNQQKEEHQYP
jgi:hypothetical protein